MLELTFVAQRWVDWITVETKCLLNFWLRIYSNTLVWRRDILSAPNWNIQSKKLHKQEQELSTYYLILEISFFLSSHFPSFFSSKLPCSHGVVTEKKRERSDFGLFVEWVKRWRYTLALSTTRVCPPPQVFRTHYEGDCVWFQQEMMILPPNLKNNKCFAIQYTQGRRRRRMDGIWI